MTHMPKRRMIEFRTNQIRVQRICRGRLLASSASRRQWTRRHFLRTTTASVALASLGSQALSQARSVELRHFFLSLHPSSLASDQFLSVGGVSYPLQRVSDNPLPLARERVTNSFLRSVPDSLITHFVQNVSVPTDCTSLAYQHSAPNPDGTWTMGAVVQLIPTSAVPNAFISLQPRHPDGKLPRSAKRQLYGLAAATSMSEILEEGVLLDSTDHARTLIALHPDLLSNDPNSASYLEHEHIQGNALTFLASVRIQTAGPASFQQTEGQPNSSGWATLIPVADKDGVVHQTSAKLNHCFPDFTSNVDSSVGQAVLNITSGPNGVKNDTTLGSDVTGFAKMDNIPDLTGKIWFRHDGNTAARSSGGAQASANEGNWSFKPLNGEAGLYVSDLTATVQNGQTQLTINNVANWFVRFLGIHLLFINPNQKVIPVANLPENTLPNGPSNDNPLSTESFLYAGVMPPAVTVAAVPVYPGQTPVVVNVPPDASTIKIYYTGLGFSGSPDSLADSEAIADVGMGLTLFINWGLAMVFIAVGASGFGPAVKLLLGFLNVTAVSEIVTVFNKGNGDLPSKVVAAAALALVRALVNAGVGKALVPLVSALAGYLEAQQIIDSIPAAGLIARAVAAALAAATLAETIIETALSPADYIFDMSSSRDVSFTIYYDKDNNSFPIPPDGYSLYYKTAYLFDEGSPHVQDFQKVTDYNQPIHVTLPNIPTGGQISASVGFYWSTGNPSDTDWCAGKGSTNLVDNTGLTVPDITIQQTKIPIGSTTRYLHTEKIILQADGTHAWQKTGEAPPYVPLSGGQQPGDLSALRSITVRQGTSSQTGYVGYSWASFSSGVTACSNAGPAQYDLAANLNTNLDAAQTSYAITSCGFPGGADNGITVAYNLIQSPDQDYYLDSKSLLVRKVSLGSSPGFDPPSNGVAYAQLNLPSSRLLLHPQGHIVSINTAAHKLETFRLPAKPMLDANASQMLVARVACGQGTRPGLMTSPVSSAVAPDGTIFVLEQGDSSAPPRVQAFDLGGNPLPYFTGQQDKYFLPLTAAANATYLDIAVEFTGFVYVLSQTNNIFRLDIYHPEQTGSTPISTTMNVTAGRIAVDFWRSLYTLNYEVLRQTNGSVPAVTEPSVSLWVATPPTSRSGHSH